MELLYVNYLLKSLKPNWAQKTMTQCSIGLVPPLRLKCFPIHLCRQLLIKIKVNIEVAIQYLNERNTLYFWFVTSTQVLKQQA